MMKVDDSLKSESSKARTGVPWREIALAWGPALLWAAAIFYVSAQNTWTVFEGPPWVNAMRKSGHVFEYAVLGLLVGRGVQAMLTSWGRKPATRRVWLRSWQLGVLIVT